MVSETSQAQVLMWVVVVLAGAVTVFLIGAMAAVAVAYFRGRL